MLGKFDESTREIIDKAGWESALQNLIRFTIDTETKSCLYEIMQESGLPYSKKATPYLLPVVNELLKINSSSSVDSSPVDAGLLKTITELLTYYKNTSNEHMSHSRFYDILIARGNIRFATMPAQYTLQESDEGFILALAGLANQDLKHFSYSSIGSSITLKPHPEIQCLIYETNESALPQHFLEWKKSLIELEISRNVFDTHAKEFVWVYKKYLPSCFLFSNWAAFVKHHAIIASIENDLQENYKKITEQIPSSNIRKHLSALMSAVQLAGCGQGVPGDIDTLQQKAYQKAYDSYHSRITTLHQEYTRLYPEYSSSLGSIKRILSQNTTSILDVVDALDCIIPTPYNVDVAERDKNRKEYVHSLIGVAMKYHNNKNTIRLIIHYHQKEASLRQIMGKHAETYENNIPLDMRTSKLIPQEDREYIQQHRSKLVILAENLQRKEKAAIDLCAKLEMSIKT